MKDEVPPFLSTQVLKDKSAADSVCLSAIMQNVLLHALGTFMHTTYACMRITAIQITST